MTLPKIFLDYLSIYHPYIYLPINCGFVFFFLIPLSSLHQMHTYPVSLPVLPLKHGSKCVLFKLHILEFLWFLLSWIFHSWYLNMWVFSQSSLLIFINRHLYKKNSKWTRVHMLWVAVTMSLSIGVY